MFLGEYYHTLDNKGRITIPAVILNQFTDGCVLTRGWEGYLIIYNKQAFMRMVRKSQELSPTVPEHRGLQRVMFSSAREAQFDKLGRVNVPAFLRGYAGLDKEVVLAGVGSWALRGVEESAERVAELGIDLQLLFAVSMLVDL